MKRKWLSVAALLLTGCSAAMKHKPKGHIVLVPRNCVVITHFDKPCEPGQGDHVCDQVHMKIKPDPDCNAYNTAEVLDVPKL